MFEGGGGRSWRRRRFGYKSPRKWGIQNFVQVFSEPGTTRSWRLVDVDLTGTGGIAEFRCGFIICESGN